MCFRKVLYWGEFQGRHVVYQFLFNVLDFSEALYLIMKPPSWPEDDLDRPSVKVFPTSSCRLARKRFPGQQKSTVTANFDLLRLEAIHTVNVLDRMFLHRCAIQESLPLTLWGFLFCCRQGRILAQPHNVLRLWRLHLCYPSFGQRQALFLHNLDHTDALCTFPHKKITLLSSRTGTHNLGNSKRQAFAKACLSICKQHILYWRTDMCCLVNDSLPQYYLAKLLTWRTDMHWHGYSKHPIPYWSTGIRCLCDKNNNASLRDRYVLPRLHFGCNRTMP